MHIKYGNRNFFAIEAELAITFTQNDFAKLSMFCKNHQIGDSNEIIIYDAFVSMIEGKLETYDYGLAKSLESHDSIYVYEYILNAFKAAPDWRVSEKFAALMLSANLAPSFDGDDVFLISSEKQDRIIWKKFDTENINEIILPSTYVINVLTSIVRRDGLPASNEDDA